MLPLHSPQIPLQRLVACLQRMIFIFDLPISVFQVTELCLQLEAFILLQQILLLHHDKLLFFFSQLLLVEHLDLLHPLALFCLY
jgi:hypothetical protein